MIFLNGLLALGALAFTVPLAIHLLFRNRFEIIDWGAMRFLESVVRVNRRRMQLRNLLLLLIRCAIPILLAFCLARPVLTGWQTLPGDEPVSVVLALDTSYSLAAQLDPSARRIDQLLNSASEIVSALPRGSDVTVVTSSNLSREEDETAIQGDPQSTLTALQELKIGGPPLSLEKLLSESLRRISSAATERRQIVLLTDDTASDFSQAQLDSLDSIGERRSSLKPAPAIAWIDPWPSTSPGTNNRRITRLEPEQSAAVPGQAVVWNVEARVDGDVPTICPLEIRVDGQPLETKTGEPRSLQFRNGLATATFNTTFADAGRHAVEVALPAEDDFSADDRMRADYVVLPPIDVWLVDGNPSDKPLQSDTDFLAIALSPFSLAGDKAVDLFRTQRVDTRKLSTQPTAARKGSVPKIVVLADVGPMRSEDAQWLADFVQNKGGTLVLFAGPATDATTWEKQLVTSDNKPMLPMAWGDVKTNTSGNIAAKIEESHLTYPPLASFAREAKGTLASVDVVSYRAMLPRTTEVNPNIILRLENGDPLMVVGEVGKGKVMQVATTANDRWTSLPRRLAFVPLMQRLFMHLATGENRTLTPFAGEPIVVDLEKPIPTDTKSKKQDERQEPSPNWNVVTPTGARIPVKPEGDKLRFADTVAAGIYRFESDGQRTIFASVNVPDADLKRTPVDAAVRDSAGKRIGATRYASVTEYQNDDSTKRFGRGVWRYLLLALLAAMIAEPILTQRGARATS